MRSQSRSILMWSVMVAALVWVAAPAEAINLKSWDNQIPDVVKRFIVLSEFAGAAVLDKETQLVWEQSPATVPTTINWAEARSTCLDKNVGGRKGWRLPAVAELASLVDPNNPGGNPDLPPGHPFTNVQSTIYWSASTDADGPTNAWGVGFGSGLVSTGSKGNILRVWCVRGGMNADAY